MIQRPVVTLGRAAVALVLALLLMAGVGWVVRAPFVDKPVAQAPDIDLTPGLAGFRDDAGAVVASSALAGSRATRGAQASASAAGGQPVDGEECGQADGPQFVETEVVFNGEAMHSIREVKAASTRFVSAQSKVDAALRASGDPFDRVVADLANVGDMRTPAGVAEAVAQQAITTNDARVYSLAYGVCQQDGEGAPGCGALTARRWTEVDAGNGMPWLEMLKEARERGDAAGQQEALSHLASAERFDRRAHAAAGAVLQRLPPDERDFGPVNAMAMQLTTVGINGGWVPLFELCRNQAGGRAAIARQCQAISAAMAEHGDDLAMLAVSGNLQLQTSGDASRRERWKAEVSRFSQSETESYRKVESTCGVVQAMSRRLLRSGQIGELPALRERARARNASTVEATSAPTMR